MKCIVGLGNPGKKYENTRHNIGFMAIDELAKRNNWSVTKSKFKGLYALEHYQGEKVILLKPQTYMNLSGESIKAIKEFYQLELEDFLVIYDDMDLPTGKIRLRQKGGHGGHNGVRNTIDHLGTKEFQRIRIGIGRPITNMTVIDYVLGDFPKEVHKDVKLSIEKAADACEAWISGQPFVEVMNEFNQ
ncbi:aminoacyl-tRNA hydrolase [Oceanobacillus piezotolerans]|uniref:Peptidyl-tRNA hydrolase n=1 Tax=Oceanobacillus piezotolerans TaxID=2448030 RepID=A0A498D5P7_9BACI|nr:aminoacyl-tRNA hydrolase [Oceanobacillus piezotolerans]RLL41815.1 aminoacyl-tRNA hydrolase [Oceanobacillus piezotolerans]